MDANTLTQLFSQIGLPIALQFAPQLVRAIKANTDAVPISSIEDAMHKGYDPGILEDVFTHIKNADDTTTDSEALHILNEVLDTWATPQRALSQVFNFDTQDIINLYNRRQNSNYPVEGSTHALESATNMFTLGVPDGVPTSGKLQSQKPNVVTIKDLFDDLYKKTTM